MEAKAVCKQRFNSYYLGITLINRFQPMFTSITPEDIRKPFLIFSGGMEVGNWLKIG